MSTRNCYVRNLLVLLLATQKSVYGFTPLSGHDHSGAPVDAVASTNNNENMCMAAAVNSRRSWLQGVAAVAGSSLVASPIIARAEDAAVAPTPLEMKEFVDPAGLFSLRVPKSFYTLRRTQKGDLPDAKTGKGRRGSSIFTAGNMAKAEVVAVERFPTRVLLEENGIQPTGDLSTFPAIGDAKAIASLITLRREKDSPAIVI